jgi:hypothetical protein
MGKTHMLLYVFILGNHILNPYSEAAYGYGNGQTRFVLMLASFWLNGCCLVIIL